MDETEDDEPAEAYEHRYLDTLHEVADAGMHLAIPAALYYCAQYQVPPPLWLTARASKLLDALLHLQDDRVRKLMRKMITTYQNDQVHYARYEAVVTGKEAREMLRQGLEDLRKKKGIQAQRVKKDWETVLSRIGPSDETIFEEVEAQLAGTAAAGGVDAIKKSYQRLCTEIRQKKSMFKYHVFDAAFLDRIGAYQEFSRKSQGKEPKAERTVTS